MLNRLGCRTGKGKLWNQKRAASARRHHSMTARKRGLRDPERVSWSEASRLGGVSHRTIERLAEAGLFEREQLAPRAPWEMRRSDLDAELVRSILERLQRSGKLTLTAGGAADQRHLFAENRGNDNARHHE